MSPRLQESSIHDQFVFHWTCSNKQVFDIILQANLIFLVVIALFALLYRARVPKKPHSADKITVGGLSVNFSCDLPPRTPEMFEICLTSWLETKGGGEGPLFIQSGQKIIHNCRSPAAAGSIQKLSPCSLEASSSAVGGMRVRTLVPLSVPPAVHSSAAASAPPKPSEAQRCLSGGRAPCQKQEKSSQQKI